MARDLLKGGDDIRLCQESRSHLKANVVRDFRILEKMSEGASAVTYRATHEQSGAGVLKEFYPLKRVNLKRGENKQLENEPQDENEPRGENERSVFLYQQEIYERPYRMMIEWKREPKHDTFSVVIPSHEIYYGCNEEGNRTGSVYIWIPEPELETFDSFCRQVQEDRPIFNADRLEKILLLVQSLTNGIILLHSEGLLHLDIKPSNFGFQKGQNGPMEQTLRLFDLDTLTSYILNREDEYDICGTERYAEPEMFYGGKRPDIQSDIYSIGMTLFQALDLKAWTDCPFHKLYEKEDTERLKEEINHSRLIGGSEMNTSRELRLQLLKILKNCLSPREQRYSVCEELYRDLEIAINEEKRSRRSPLIRYQFEEDYRHRFRLMTLIQMYRSPLYEGADSIIRISVFGFDACAQTFTDICLMLGQIPEYTLYMRIYPSHREEVDNYLEHRPALKDFFHIDGISEDVFEPYGHIRFEAAVPVKDEEVFRKLSDLTEEEWPQQIFIAPSEDEEDPTNIRVVEKVRDICSERNCRIRYLTHRLPESGTEREGIWPIYMETPLSEVPEFGELERMAFNFHFLRKSDETEDFDRIWKSFKEHRSYAVGFSEAVFTKYQMEAAGLGKTEDLQKAAVIFQKKISGWRQKKGKNAEGDNNEKLIDILICSEHRRWVTENICRGMTRLPEIRSDLCGQLQDRESKEHLCLVRSRPDHLLAQYSDWDALTEKEENALDELDRVSLNLHRRYRLFTEGVERQKDHYQRLTEAVEELLGDSIQAKLLAAEWKQAADKLWLEEHPDLRTLNRLTDAVEKMAIAGTEYANVPETEETVKEWKRFICPMIESKRYLNFKEYDRKMLLETPYILTYSKETVLEIPYIMGTYEEIFHNLKAPLIVNPAEVRYLCLIETRKEADELKKELDRVMGIINHRKMRCKIELHIITNVITENQAEEIFLGKDDLCKKLIRGLRIFRLSDEEETQKNITEYLRLSASENPYFALERNSGRVSYFLSGCGIYREIPSYRLHPELMKIEDGVKSIGLSCITKRPSLSISDLKSFHGTAVSYGLQPNYFECYKELWEIYSEDPVLWKKLCQILCSEIESSEMLMEIKESEDEKEIRQYYLPESCEKGVRKILENLVKGGFLEESPELIVRKRNTYEINLKASLQHQEQYRNLFMDQDALRDVSNLEVVCSPNGMDAKIIRRRLNFNNISLSGKETEPEEEKITTDEQERMYRILKCLEDTHIIMNLRKACTEGDNLSVSFGVSTLQDMDLFREYGRILEVYVYHCLKASGHFSDVMASCNLYWKADGIKNEIGCIVTAGIRTICIECKAGEYLSPDFYFKLETLSRNFGIHPIPILIADIRTQENPQLVFSLRERGEELGVETVTDVEDIKTIDEYLKSIIDRKNE